MSLHKLSAGSGYAYLTRQVAADDVTARGRGSLGEYYAERGESPGVWLGAGLASLEGGPRPGDPVSRGADGGAVRPRPPPDADQSPHRRCRHRRCRDGAGDAVRHVRAAGVGGRLRPDLLPGQERLGAVGARRPRRSPARSRRLTRRRSRMWSAGWSAPRCSPASGPAGSGRSTSPGCSRWRSPTATPAPGIRTCTPTWRSPTRSPPSTGGGGPWTGARCTPPWLPRRSGTTPGWRRSWSTGSASPSSNVRPGRGRGRSASSPVSQLSLIEAWSTRRAPDRRRRRRAGRPVPRHLPAGSRPGASGRRWRSRPPWPPGRASTARAALAEQRSAWRAQAERLLGPGAAEHGRRAWRCTGRRRQAASPAGLGRAGRAAPRWPPSPPSARCSVRITSAPSWSASPAPSALPLRPLDAAVDAALSTALSDRVTIRVGGDPDDRAAVGVEPAGLRRRDGTSVYTPAHSQLYTTAAVLDAERRILAAADRGRRAAGAGRAGRARAARGPRRRPPAQPRPADAGPGAGLLRAARAGRARPGRHRQDHRPRRARRRLDRRRRGRARRRPVRGRHHRPRPGDRPTGGHPRVRAPLPRTAGRAAPRHRRGCRSGPGCCCSSTRPAWPPPPTSPPSSTRSPGQAGRCGWSATPASSPPPPPAASCATSSALHGATELDTPIRFADPAEAQASLAIRAGDPAGLDFYAAHGRIHAPVRGSRRGPRRGAGLRAGGLGGRPRRRTRQPAAGRQQRRGGRAERPRPRHPPPHRRRRRRRRRSGCATAPPPRPATPCSPGTTTATCPSAAASG